MPDQHKLGRLVRNKSLFCFQKVGDYFKLKYELKMFKNITPFSTSNIINAKPKISLLHTLGVVRRRVLLNKQH